MKKIILTNVLLALLFSILLMSCTEKQIQTIPLEEVPIEIRHYVTDHFTNHKIIQAIKDEEMFTNTYELILDSNTQLEFNAKGYITDINGVSKLPNSVIPEGILNYARSHYPENYIIGWEINDKNQQIELENNVNLIFNIKGDFLRIDID